MHDAGSYRSTGGHMIWARVVAVLAMLAAIFTGGVVAGKGHVQAKWDAETVARKTAEAAAVIDRVAENKQIADRQQLDNQRITKAHNDEITQVRTALARSERLRVGPGLCSGFASAPDTGGTGSSDGADTSTRLLPDALDRDIRALILEVEEVAATGRACQAFVRSGGMGLQSSTP